MIRTYLELLPEAIEKLIIEYTALTKFEQALKDTKKEASEIFVLQGYPSPLPITEEGNRALKDVVKKNGALDGIYEPSIIIQYSYEQSIAINMNIEITQIRISSEIMSIRDIRN